jgi:serine protease Do
MKLSRSMHTTLFAFVAVLAMMSVSPRPALAHGMSGLPDFTQLVESAGPAVVRIDAVQKRQMKIPQLGMDMPDLPEGSPFQDLPDMFRKFFEREHGGNGGTREFESQSLGAGTIISADGYILTNHHVVDGAESLKIHLFDKRELEARVIGSDPESDIALIKIDATGLPVAKIGKSENIKVGEWVLAIGSPFGFERSATAGIVSATGRHVPGEEGAYNYVRFIQTDVAINPGNSGGPLLNLDGEVVGINSMIYSKSGGYMGLSFAVPIDVAMDVVQQLRSNGKVTRGYLGVLIQPVTRDLAEAFGMDRPRGALVAQVMEDAAASRAGVQVGDVILRFNGQEVASNDSLPPIVGRSPLDRPVPMVVLRDGKQLTLQVRLGELTADVREAMRGSSPAPTDTAALEIKPLGIQVRPIDEETRANGSGLPATGGVEIVSIAEGAQAAQVLMPGDYLLNLNGDAVLSPAQLQELVSKADLDRPLRLYVRRDDSNLFVAMRLAR